MFQIEFLCPGVTLILMVILAPTHYLDTFTMGTVIFVYDASMEKIHIQWDLDDTKTDIKIDDLTIEAQGSPKQTIKPQESSKEN